jgi:FAD/FMN-containing dehydrogenase
MYSRGWRDPVSLDIGGLKREVRGPILNEDSESLVEEIAGFNTAVNHRPAVVVGATCERDVEAAVRFASRHGLGVGVQSTGHGRFLPVTGGVLITTKRMDAVTVNPERRTATLGAGVRWRQVIEASAVHGLAPMSGSSSSVGAVGYMLGGGLGPLARKHGFAADHITRVRLVTADGQTREVDAEHEPDLFWAVRGGKGNFGVVTEVEIGLLPVSEVFTASIYYSAGSIAPVLRTYAGWVEDLPEEDTSSIAVLRLPDMPGIPTELRGQTVAHFRLVSCSSGSGASFGTAPPARLTAMLTAGHVVRKEIGPRPYSDLDHVHADPVDPIPVWQRSAQLRTLSNDVVSDILAAVGPESVCTLDVLEIRHLGGALARPSRPSNAVAGRNGAFSLLLLGIPQPGEEQAVADEGAAVLSRLRTHLTGRSLANWLGCATTPEEVAAAWEPEDRARLVAVKNSVDPQNLFRYGHPLAAHPDRALLPASAGPATDSETNEFGRDETGAKVALIESDFLESYATRMPD